MPSNTNWRMICAILGLIVGLGVGYLTRPTVPLIGFQIPLEVLTSTARADAPFRQQLLTHLGVATVIGAAAGIAAGIVLQLVAAAPGGRTPAPVHRPAGSSPARHPAKTYDVSRWNALVEYDPELKAAAARLAIYGPKYIDALATDFLALNDKSYLPTIVRNVEKLARSDFARGVNPPDYDVHRWSYYSDYDHDVRAAVQRLSQYGPGYVDMLARAFLAANNDKSMIDSLVAMIEDRAITDLESPHEDRLLSNS